MGYTHQEEVQIEQAGKAFTGYFSIDGDLITVSYGSRSTTTQLGNSAAAPRSLARVILRELVEEPGA